MIVNDSQTKNVHWKSVRLKPILSSQEAGNTGQINAIDVILEKLDETGFLIKVEK